MVKFKSLPLSRQARHGTEKVHRWDKASHCRLVCQGYFKLSAYKTPKHTPPCKQKRK